MKEITEFWGKDYKFYIYGTTNLAIYCYKKIISEMGDSKIIAFIETKPRMSSCQGIPVIKPEDVDYSDKDIRLVIGSVKYETAMIEKLISCGASKETIIVLEDYKPLFNSLWDSERDGIDSICYWPPFDGAEEEEMVISKIEWYIPEEVKVTIFSDGYLPETTSKNIFVEQIQNADEVLFSASMIYLWDADSVSDLKGFEDKIFLVDKDFFHTSEIGNYQLVHFYSLDKKEKDKKRNESICSFEAMKCSKKNSCKTNIFCNGPSIYEFLENEDVKIEGDFNAVVNMTICDKLLVDLIKPTCWIVGDSVYLSPIKYNKELFSAVMDAWERYKFWIIMFEHEKAAFDYHFPQLKDYTIGIPFSYDYQDESFSFPSKTSFYTRATYNVLTELAIPIASSISDTIGLYGCTGRGKMGKKSWSYSDKTISTRIHDGITYMWPSVYRDKLWDEDYDLHCNTVERIIEYGEKMGKRYESMTTSFIPALEKRMSKVY